MRVLERDETCIPVVVDVAERREVVQVVLGLAPATAAVEVVGFVAVQHVARVAVVAIVHVLTVFAVVASLLLLKVTI